MKREIKFRAWDKRKKIWVSVGFHILGETTLFGLIETYCLENREDGEGSLERMNDIEITEFTGLKDKNSKEIYEGDICIMKEIKLSGTNEFSGYVDFNLSSWVLNFNSPRGYKLRRRLSEFHEAEIIGNIYENPELL